MVYKLSGDSSVEYSYVIKDKSENNLVQETSSFVIQDYSEFLGRKSSDGLTGFVIFNGNSESSTYYYLAAVLLLIGVLVAGFYFKKGKHGGLKSNSGFGFSGFGGIKSSKDDGQKTISVFGESPKLSNSDVSRESESYSMHKNHHGVGHNDVKIGNDRFNNSMDSYHGKFNSNLRLKPLKQDLHVLVSSAHSKINSLNLEEANSIYNEILNQGSNHGKSKKISKEVKIQVNRLYKKLCLLSMIRYAQIYRNNNDFVNLKTALGEISNNYNDLAEDMNHEELNLMQEARKYHELYSSELMRMNY